MFWAYGYAIFNHFGQQITQSLIYIYTAGLYIAVTGIPYM